MTGLRAAGLDITDCLEVGGRLLRRARVFSDVQPGEAFWYENASGLVEIAVNRGSAAQILGLTLGQAVTLTR
jgi:S-adenosylmethionine hydrolase